MPRLLLLFVDIDDSELLERDGRVYWLLRVAVASLGREYFDEPDTVLLPRVADDVVEPLRELTLLVDVLLERLLVVAPPLLRVPELAVPRLLEFVYRLFVFWFVLVFKSTPKRRDEVVDEPPRVAEERATENELLPERARLDVYLTALFRVEVSYFEPKERLLLLGELLRLMVLLVPAGPM